MEMEFFCLNDPYFEAVESGVRGFTYKNYEIEPHAHAFYEINIVQAGKGTHIIEDNRFDARVGNVFVIPPGTVHAYENEGGLEVYHIVLHPRFFETYLPERRKNKGLLLLTEIEPFLRKNGAVCFLRLTGAQLLALQSDLEVLTDGGAYDYPGADALKRHTALKVFYYWAHLLEMQTNEQEALGEYDATVMQALEYIHKNYAEKITIETLCEVTFSTRSTLLRHFVAVCGCSPMQYLRRCRLQRAREELALKRKNKTEIAQECGYYDLSHMEREIRNGKA